MAEKAAGTEYVVLRQCPVPGLDAPSVEQRVTWEPVGTTTRATRDDAIKAVAEGLGANGSDALVYKAVPVRSWKGGLRISVEHVTKTKTEPVDD